MMSEENCVERLDPEAAAIHASTNPKPSGVVPHHLRCDWMRGKKRCILSTNHSEGHKYE
jgi:hypothetical protein